MRGLISVFIIRFKLLIQYRMAALAGIFTQFFFGFVMIMAYEAFFQSTQATNEVMPMNLQQTITYIWLGQGLLGLIPWNGDREIQKMIKMGEFAYELVRPIDLYNLWAYRALALRLAPTLLKATPLFIVTYFIIPEPYNLSAPSSIEGVVCFLIVLVGSIILGITITNFITISVLLTIGDGIERLFPAIVIIFSGMVIPIAFFPDWSQGLFKILPFSGLVDAPYRFYLGMYTVKDLSVIIIHQIVWSIIMVAIGKGLLRAASKRIVVQGG